MMRVKQSTRVSEGCAKIIPSWPVRGRNCEQKRLQLFISVSGKVGQTMSFWVCG